MISTRGRYAIRIMIELADNYGKPPLAMKNVAARQGISLKYAERILPELVANGLIEGSRGKGGGYYLTRPPEEYTVFEILRASEGDMAPVACLSDGANGCERACECRTLPLWKGYYELTERYFSGVNLSDLLRKPHLLDT